MSGIASAPLPRCESCVFDLYMFQEYFKVKYFGHGWCGGAQFECMTAERRQK